MRTGRIPDRPMEFFVFEVASNAYIGMIIYESIRCLDGDGDDTERFIRKKSIFYI